MLFSWILIRKPSLVPHSVTVFSGAWATLWWIENPSDLRAFLPILRYSGSENLKLFMQALTVSKGSGPVYQHGK
jgi:hypothetical protein